jgi:spore coat protein U-like protein
VKLNNLILSVIFLGYAGMAWGQECQVTVSPLNFGDYHPFSGAPRDATGKITVTCDAGLPFTVKLDQGVTPERSFNPRELGAAGRRDTLQFNLYRDSARQEIWGDGTGNTFVVTGTGTGNPITLTVFGRIQPRQNVPVEHYSDQIYVIVEQ